MALWTALSFTLSKADVASSKRRILGFFKNALARAILCFYPPESWLPPEPPTYVSNFFSSFSTKSQILAALRASMISSSEAFGSANSIFSLMLVLKSTGS